MNHHRLKSDELPFHEYNYKVFYKHLVKGISQTVNGDIIFGANGADGGYSRLPLGTYDSSAGVGQILQVGSSNNIVWSNTIDGGTLT